MKIKSPAITAPVSTAVMNFQTRTSLSTSEKDPCSPASSLLSFLRLHRFPLILIVCSHALGDETWFLVTVSASSELYTQ